MRLIKMFGLGAVAAVVAMAFVGATSASAATTEICLSHGSLACIVLGASSVSMTNVGVGTLLTDLVDILCLQVDAFASPQGLGNSQLVYVSGLSFQKCGTKSEHNNCQVEVLELPLTNHVNKTGLDAGTITGSQGLTLVLCDNIDIFGIDLHCVYDGTGLTFSVGAQHLTANDTWINAVEGEYLCPDESFLDGLLTTNVSKDAGDNRYVLA